MKHLVFHPPKKEQILIEQRCSALNVFTNPMDFERPNHDMKAETMTMWDRIHDIVQYTMMMWEEKWLEVVEQHIKELKTLWPYHYEDQYRWFTTWSAYQYVELAKQYTCQKIEQKRTAIIDFSWYQVYFSWSSDAEDKNIDVWWDTYGQIVDIKSSRAKWKQEQADNERQKYYYTLLKCFYEWLDWCKFSYNIYTKQKTVQHQVFEYLISYEEAFNVTKNDLKFYIMSQDVWLQ